MADHLQQAQAAVSGLKTKIRELEQENELLRAEIDRLKQRQQWREKGNNEARPKKVPKQADKPVPTKEADDWQTFEATAYTAFCDTGCTGVTATGLDVSNTIETDGGQRVIAVDPNVIKLGTTVEIRLADGSSITAKAVDTGGAIKGNRIDLLVSDEGTANKFGRQSVKVRILN